MTTTLPLLDLLPCRHRNGELSPGRHRCLLTEDGPHGKPRVMAANGVTLEKCAGCAYRDRELAPLPAEVYERPKVRTEVADCIYLGDVVRDAGGKAQTRPCPSCTGHVEKILFRCSHPRTPAEIVATDCKDCTYHCPKPAPVTDLKGYFDRVVVLNLKRRPDRLAAFRGQLERAGWPFATPVVFEAVDGQKVPVPTGFTHGAGTWGCLASHREIIGRAIQDDVQRLLVLEDDLTLKPTFAADVAAFLRDVPDDWDQLMIGGQHRGPNRVIRPGVNRTDRCERTHAYAVRGKYMRDFYSHICSRDCFWHVDWAMGAFQKGYRVYAPEPFPCGQARSKSDINGRVNPAKSWVNPTGQEPVVLLDCPTAVVRALRSHGVHTGYNRTREDIDVGLVAAFAQPDPRPQLRKWFHDLQSECISDEGLVLGVWHPQATAALVRECWPGPLLEVKAATAEEALAQLQGVGELKPRPTLAHEAIVLLRATKEVAAELAGIGWHQGYWTDPATRLDRGLVAWAQNGKKPAGLAEIVGTLVREAETIVNGLACVRHPDVTAEMLTAAAGDVRVIEVVAASREEAVSSWSHQRAASYGAKETREEA